MVKNLVHAHLVKKLLTENIIFCYFASLEHRLFSIPPLSNFHNAVKSYLINHG